MYNKGKWKNEISSLAKNWEGCDLTISFSQYTHTCNFILDEMTVELLFACSIQFLMEKFQAKANKKLICYVRQLWKRNGIAYWVLKSHLWTCRLALLIVSVLLDSIILLLEPWALLEFMGPRSKRRAPPLNEKKLKQQHK